MHFSDAASQTADEVCRLLHSRPSGLTPAEATARLIEHGPNVIPEKKYRGWLEVLAKQLTSPLIWLMIVAAIISGFIGESVDAIVILFTTLLNVSIGAGQELESERILADLRALAKPQTLVQRGGLRSVSADQLVPGDIVVLEEGSRIPADGRVVTAFGLAIDESTFTGESLPSNKTADPLVVKPSLKNASNILFMGTTVSHGRGTFVVTTTGAQTELGQLARTLDSAISPQSPLGEQVQHLTLLLARAIGVSLLILLFAGWINHIELSDLLLTTISVAVAALPEGLPLLITVVLVYGISRLAKQRALVRRTEAVETLGQVQILMTDKTGTLTKNRLGVNQLILPDGPKWQVAPADAIRSTDGRFSQIWSVIFHANGAPAINWQNHPDPIDRALMGFARQYPLDRTAGRLTKIGELPFDSTSKIMAAVYKNSARQATVYLKGAPEQLIKLCGWVAGPNSRRRLSDSDRKKFRTAWQSVAQQGEKIIATARLEVSHTEWERVSTSRPAALKAWSGRAILCGAVSFADELRSETPKVIAAAQAAGIRVVMVTGDNATVATAVGQQVGLRGPAATKIPETAADRRALLQRCDIFADVTPKMKLELVRAWQKQGFVVAMTGDGVNDTPALAAADCGLALGSSGTDLAKDAADIIILNDNLATIVRAVEQGRTTFRNVQRVIAFLIATNMAELSVLLLGTLAAGAWPLPLLPIQILWVNLVTDSVSVIPLAIEPDHDDTMVRPPRGRRDPLISPLVSGHIITTAIATTISTLIGFGLAWRLTGEEQLARTVAFSTMVTSQLTVLLSTRSLKTPIRANDFVSNPALPLAFIGGWILQLFIVNVPLLASWLKISPLNTEWWVRIALLSLLPLVVLEIRKRRLVIHRPTA